MSNGLNISLKKGEKIFIIVNGQAIEVKAIHEKTSKNSVMINVVADKSVAIIPPYKQVKE